MSATSAVVPISANGHAAPRRAYKAIHVHSSTRNTKSGVSKPDVVQVRKVRLVSTPHSTSATMPARAPIHARPADDHAMAAVSATEPAANTRLTVLAVAGGSCPVSVQIASSSATHRKLV